jgi:hypothetical protein
VTDRIIEDLPGGWRGVIHDLAVTLKLAEPAPGEPTPGEREAMREMDVTDPAGEREEAAMYADLEDSLRALGRSYHAIPQAEEVDREAGQ